MLHYFMKILQLIIFVVVFSSTLIKAKNYTTKEIDSIITYASKLSDKKNALEISLDCYQSSDKIGYSKGKMQSLKRIILIYYFTYDQKKIIYYCDKLQNLAHREKEYDLEIFALANKACAYANAGFFYKAEEAISESITIAKKLKGNSFYNAMGFINQIRGGMEGERGDRKKEFHFQKQSLSFYNKITDLTHKRKCISGQYYNLALCYLYAKQPDLALYYSKLAVKESRLIKNRINEGMGLFGVGSAYNDAAQYDSAIHYFQKALPILESIEDSNKIFYIYDGMVNIYKIKGDAKKYDYYNNKLEQAQLKYEKKNKAITNDISTVLLLEEKKIWYSSLYVVVSGIAVISVVLVFFIIRFFKKYRNERKENEYREASLREKNEKLELKVNVAFSEVIELAKNDSPAFLSRFKEVYPEFYTRLTSAYPNLTVSQLRFCAVLRLNFSTKEIAHYHRMTIKGVQLKKNRLRKQLGVSSHIDLNIWMMEF